MSCENDLHGFLAERGRENTQKRVAVVPGKL